MSGPKRTFAEHVGLTAAHAEAARRVAEDRQARGEHHAALYYWALSLLVEPSDAAGLRGFSRGLEALDSAVGGAPRTLRTRRTS